ncbi:MAG: histidine triad nucleotide-binding protein [Alphaproteobacteria bacterium CG11_big_fil_rev_8_21_14_0_20_39_49]|nr:MAG: histidine triad nucleotide-binding protein [Alphaproteobacteria bacterium CG11_big_fil_rev_8_21_14_0_20_39_49]
MHSYDNDNIFAKIIRGEIPCDKVYSDDDVFAFKDIAPAAPVHVLVIPKGQYVSFDDFVADSSPEKVAGFFAKVREIAAELGLDKTGYRLISNHGADANQAVPHFHVHILGGKKLGGLLQSDKLQR